jgi:hypothetical protein
MSKVRDISGLANIIKTDANGNVTFVSGSTTLMAISSSGAVTSTGTIGGSNSSTLATTGSNTFTGQQYVSNTNAPVNFTDTASLYTDGGLRVGKDAYVSGTLYLNNLTVFGTQSVNFITSSQLDISDNIITVNTSTPSIRFGGIAVRDSGSAGTGLTGSLLWDSQNNHWVYTNPSGSSYSGGMMISGPRASSLGEEQGTTNNALMKGQGGDHITSSGIFESGSNMGIGTSSPGYKLDVQGTGRFTDALTTSNISTSLTNGTVLIRDNGTAQVEVNIRHSSTRNGVLSFTENGVADRWAIGTKPSDGTLYFASGFDLSTPRLTLSSAGNVQIGSSANSAGYGLEVYGGNQRVVVQDNANGTAGVFFRVLSGGSQVGNVTLRTDNTGTFSVFTGTSGEGERMRITSGGDVSMTGTGAIKIHSGTTAQRPTAAAGQIRYNTSLGEVEVNNGSNWGSLQTKVMLGSSPSNPAESANDIKTYYPNATNGFYWIRQTGSTAVSAYCVFKDFTGADIAGGPWTVPIISNDANTNYSTNGATAAATFLSRCQAIGINTPGRGMESSRTTTEVYGAWLAVKRTIWEAYTPFVANGNTSGGAVLRMPMININGEGGTTAQRLIYNTSLSTHIPPNIDGDSCNANQLFCGWWAATDISGWRTNNNDLPGPEDWGPADNANTSYNGAGVNSVLTICVYK